MSRMPEPLRLWRLATAAPWANGQRAGKELLGEGAQLSSSGDRLGL